MAVAVGAAVEAKVLPNNPKLIGQHAKEIARGEWRGSRRSRLFLVWVTQYLGVAKSPGDDLSSMSYTPDKSVYLYYASVAMYLDISYGKAPERQRRRARRIYSDPILKNRLAEQ